MINPKVFSKKNNQGINSKHREQTMAPQTILSVLKINKITMNL
jgi:hypothetical protein